MTHEARPHKNRSALTVNRNDEYTYFCRVPTNVNPTLPF
jgi:hypothetical protein